VKVVNISNYSTELILKSALGIKSGKLVVFPTETVYGLGADATNQSAVSRIYATKGRPSDHPLIVHISSSDKLSSWAKTVPDYAYELADKYWPGPMTLILPRKKIAKDFITGGQNSIGLRVPGHTIAIELLKSFEAIGGLGIAAPSANRFGAVSPTTAESVLVELGEHLSDSDLIIQGGQCQIGLESTIIDCTSNHPIILRPGAVTIEMIRSTIKTNVTNEKRSTIVRVPGMHQSHYSPKAKVELNRFAMPGEGFIAMKGIPTPQGAIRLLAPENDKAFAKGIYLALRAGDEKKLSKIAVIIPDGDGLAEAIRDRITKASS
jgi:L-threonylcarbamoyladenylate synthase